MPTVRCFNASRTVKQHDFPAFIHQFDFERLYTELEQADLIAKLHDFVDRAFALHAGKVLKISNRKAGKSKWVLASRVPQRPDAAETYLNASRVKELITLIVEEAFVQVGDAIFRQVKGIPMGVNPACYFANLYLFMYELAFFEQLLMLDTPDSRRVCETFRFTNRLIDDVDIITPEGKGFVQSFLYTHQLHLGIRGIYPSRLNLKDSGSDNPHHSDFLDLHIQPACGDHGPLQTSIFDKRQQPQFRERLATIRFPAPYSMLSSRCKLNVFDSQFVRYARLITSLMHFIESVASLMNELVQKGYKVAHIEKRCRLKIRDFPNLFGTQPGNANKFKHAKGLFHAIRHRFRVLMCESAGTT